MGERKRTVQDASGRRVNGTAVDVTEAIERFSEVKLDDGTTLKTRMVVTEVTRIDDQWDNENNPVYSVKSKNIIVVDDASEDLKRKVPVQ